MAWQELQGALCNAPWNKHLVVVTWAGQPILETFQFFGPDLHNLLRLDSPFLGGWMTFFLGGLDG